MRRRTPFAALISAYVVSVAGTSMSAIAIPWLVLAVGQVVWFVVVDDRLAWAHVSAAAVTAVGMAVFVIVVPLWRYRVHRWDISPQAVFTRSGWLVQERRIAPISVTTQNGPFAIQHSR